MIQAKILKGKIQPLNRYQLHYSVSHKQVTRGHNIVADGWAGAYNLNSHPHPPRTHSQTVTTGASKLHVFMIFNLIIMMTD